MAIERLGEGPFQVVDFWTPDEVLYGGHQYDLDGDSGRCACCGHEVSWRVIVHDCANDRHVVMGRDCAKTASDLDLHQIEKLERKAKSERFNKAMCGLEGQAFRDWAKQQPHPKGWNGRNLLDDLGYWWQRRKSLGEQKIARALKAFGKGDLSIVTKAEEKAQKARAERKAKADKLERERQICWAREKAQKDLASWNIFEFMTLEEIEADIPKAEKLAQKLEIQKDKIKAEFKEKWGEEL